MSHRTLVCSAALAIVISSAAVGDSKNLCGAIEAAQEIEGHREYNTLVCSGISQMNNGDFDLAARTFENALQKNLLDWPNFMLLPRLALAYFKSGNIGDAQNTLKVAELSLLVFSGMAKCVEDQTGTWILRYAGASCEMVGSQIEGDAASVALRTMCGAAYAYVYDRRSLRFSIQESKLIENYLSIKELIDGGENHAR